MSLDIKIVTTVFSGTAALLRENFKPLVKGVGFLLLLSIALEYAGAYFYDEEVLFSFAEVVNTILYCLVYLAIAVKTHRIVIGEFMVTDSPSDESAYSNGASYFRFALRSLALMGIALVIFFILGVGASLVDAFGSSIIFLYIVGAVFGLYCLWHYSRLFIALPSIAVGRPMSIPESFGFSENHKLLMFTVVVIIPLLLYVPFFWVTDWLLRDDGWLLDFITTILYACFTVIEVVVLSLAYKIISSEAL